MREERGKTKGFLLGMFAGGLAGGLIALLYAPKSGRELRKDIGRKKDELVDDAGEYINSAKGKAANVIAAGRKKADEFISEAKHKADSIIKGAENVYSQGRDFITDSSSKLKDAVKAGVDTYKDERHKDFNRK